MAQVEAKYPALLFKQQLDAFVQKIFPMLRDNVKKEVTPQLAACIHAPRAATTRGRRGGGAPADLASPRAPPRVPHRARVSGGAAGRAWCIALHGPHDLLVHAIEAARRLPPLRQLCVWAAHFRKQVSRG